MDTELIQSLLSRIEELERFKDSLGNVTEVPFEVREALRVAIIPDNALLGAVTAGTPATTTVVTGVNFGTSSTTTGAVAAPFTGKIRITFADGTTKDIPTI